jgi:hypothetical protein
MKSSITSGKIVNFTSFGTSSFFTDSPEQPSHLPLHFPLHFPQQQSSSSKSEASISFATIGIISLIERMNKLYI